MSNELQDAIGEAVTELQSFAGESFTFASTTFKAWRVQSFTVVPGRLESAPDSTNTYEAVRVGAPAFKLGDKLTDSVSATRRVGSVHAVDTTTGLFRFTLQ